MTRATKGKNTWALVLGLAAGLLAAALPAPEIVSADAPSYAKTRFWAFEAETPAGVGAERDLSANSTRGYGEAYDGQAVGYPLVPGGTARFVVDPSGQTRIFLRNGTLEVSEHAALRVTQRGLTLDAVEGVVTNQQPFRYFHNGVWKTGYYDPASRVFVGTVDDTVTTVINNATPKYIQNLQAAQP